MLSYNDQMSTTSALSLFHTTKKERTSFVQDVVARVTSGEADPELVLITLKCMESIVKEITGNEDFKACVIAEAEKYGKRHERYNATLEVKEAGTRYNFEQCGDLELLELYTQRADLDEKIKKREAFIKTIPIEGIEVVLSDTGEIMHVYPPSKSSTTTVAVTLK